MDSSREKPFIEIAGRKIGPGLPLYIVAEMSANHLGRLDRAIAIIEAAAAAGADAVKLQIYTADSLTIDCDRPPFIVQSPPWKGRKLYDLYLQAATPWSWYRELAAVAQRLGITLFSSPFCKRSIEFLEPFEPPAYKIASFELVDFELLEWVAMTARPVILSTGAATVPEVAEAVDVLKSNGCKELALLHCVSMYPAATEQMYLKRLLRLKSRFTLPIGLSDHSLDPFVPSTAAQLGACIIEKHLTLSRMDGGVDAAFSLEPQEFASMVTAVRSSWESRDEGGCIRMPEKTDMDEVIDRPASLPGTEFRRSLFAVQDIAAGEPFTRENVRTIRPGAGLHPRHLREILGRKSSEFISRGTPLSWGAVKE